MSNNMVQLKIFLNWKYLSYVGVVLVIILPWFFRSGYLFFTDMSWGPNLSLSWINDPMLLYLFENFFSIVIPISLIQKIYIGLILFIVLWGGKKISEQFIQEKWLVFVASLFFLFNPFVYDRAMYGQINVVASFGFMCMAFGYLLEYLRLKRTKQMLLFGLFSGLSIQFSVHFVFFISFIYILFLLIILMRRKEFEFYSLAKGSLATVIIIVLLNMNLAIGMMSGKSNVVNYIKTEVPESDLFVFKTSGKSGIEALGNVLLMSGFWGKDQYRYADLTRFESNWGRSFFLILPIIFLGIFIGLRRKESRLLVTVLLISYAIVVILSVGVSLSGTKEITLWLFHNFPLYKGLREPQKWVSFLVIIYGTTLAFGLNELFSRKIITDNKFLYGAILTGIIILQSPLLIFGFGDQVKSVSYPQDWQEVDNYITTYNSNNSADSQTKCRDPILFLPWHMYMSFNWIGHIVANPADRFFSCPVIQGTNMEWGGIYDNSQSVQGAKIQEWIDSKGQDKSLLNSQELSIKYIILAKELDWQNYLWLDTSPDATLFRDTRTLRVYRINEQNTKNNK